MRRRSIIPLATAALLASGCEGLVGYGEVDATFFVDDCPPGTERIIDDYHFEAGWLATERYWGVVIINVQEYRVRVEETDGLSVRLEMQQLLDAGLLRLDEQREQIVRADGTKPLRLPIVAEGAGFANASLNLFQTCPNFPTLHATSGTLELTELTLSADAADTGRQESIAGTVTATIARVDNLLVPAGIVSSTFDFEPPERPTASFE